MKKIILLMILATTYFPHVFAWHPVGPIADAIAGVGAKANSTLEGVATKVHKVVDDGFTIKLKPSASLQQTFGPAEIIKHLKRTIFIGFSTSVGVYALLKMKNALEYLVQHYDEQLSLQDNIKQANRKKLVQLSACLALFAAACTTIAQA